jgi:hypothetical protein
MRPRWLNEGPVLGVGCRLLRCRQWTGAQGQHLRALVLYAPAEPEPAAADAPRILCRLALYADSYDFQSKAEVEFFDPESRSWSVVEQIPYPLLASVQAVEAHALPLRGRLTEAQAAPLYADLIALEDLGRLLASHALQELTLARERGR